MFFPRGRVMFFPRNRPAATRMAKDKQPKPILKIYWVRKKEKSPFMWKIVYIGSARGHQLRGTCRKLPVGLVQPRKKWESLGVESKAWFWSSTQVDWTPTQSRLKYNQVHRKSPFSLERGPKCSLSFRFYTKNEKESIIILRLPNENDFLSLAHGGERVAAQAALFTQFLDLIGTLPSKAPSVLLLQVWIYQPNLSWEEALKGKEVAHWPLHGWMPIFE